MKLLKTLVLILLAAGISSCSSWKRINYFQGVQDQTAINVTTDYQIRLKPLDRITVVVSSKDPELAAPFNATTSFNSVSGSSTGSTSYSGTSSLQIRTIDQNGNLEMPIIGMVKCAGKTRQELAQDIAKMIIDGGYISDAMVNIQFADLKIFIIGEVARPGQYDITRDRITILDALAMAGDLTIYGDRSKVFVIRNTEGKETISQINLLDQSVFNSPAFFLDQGDVVYVQPNRYKSATAEINQNRTFWLSIISTLISVATLIVTAVK